jgi:hypothetical protein
MKILYHEIMFSIIDGVPYARLFDYFHNEKGEAKKIIWYRDIAYVGLFLEAVGRTDLIDNFIMNIQDMYDGNRNVKEPDNLGQILYLQSLVEHPNYAFVQDIVNEAKRICDDDGNLTGTTDGSRSSAYQNGWLIFALKRLGMEREAALFNPHSTIDANGYSRLLWFTLPKEAVKLHSANREILVVHRNKNSKYANVAGQSYPYINIGMDHFAMRSGKAYNNPLLTQVVYPLTWGDGTRPHIWHAVELMMYLMELKKPYFR